MNHYVDRLKTLKPDVAEQFKLIDKDGIEKPWDPETIEQGTYLTVPNNKQFVEFLRRVEMQHDLKIPAAFISNEPTSEHEKKNQISNAINNAIVGAEREKSLKELKTDNPEELINILEVIREKATELEKRQKELQHEVESLVNEYKSTGDENKLLSIISINSQLLDLKSEQSGLKEIYNELQDHIARTPSVFTESMVEQSMFTNDALNKNTLTEQPDNNFVTNVNELREELKWTPEFSAGNSIGVAHKGSEPQPDNESDNIAHQPIELENEKALTPEKSKGFENDSQDFSF
tara:strand:+ start:579 stop:1451 length:873 start_codon:yes stop_codon:yes gene_type:complete